MNTYIQSQAEHLSKISRFDNFHKSREIKDKISEFLSQFYSANDRMEFLTQYQALMNDLLLEHKKKCSKEDCAYMATNRSITFFVDQEIAQIKKEEERERFWTFGTIIENLTISGDGQIFNFGKVEGDIKQNLKILNDNGDQNISKSIEELVSAIQTSTEVQEQQKIEYLDTLKILSAEAAKPKDKRLPYSTLKTIIKYSLGTLNAFSSISTIVGINLTNIADYFLSKD